MSEEKAEYDVPKSVTLTREQVMDVNDIQIETLDVPEWGGSIKIRGLSVGEVSHIVRLSTRKGVMDTMQSAMYTFIRGVVEPKFADIDIDDLKKKSALVLRIVKDINRLSGISTDEDVVDEMEKK